jgi:hypothetical protein
MPSVLARLALPDAIAVYVVDSRCSGAIVDKRDRNIPEK